MVDPRLLATFLEVVKRGSMADAAYQLHLTAPAVSQQISRLEAELSVKLFNRTNAGVSPTTAGLTLAEKSVSILGDLATLTSVVIEADGREPAQLRVASFASGCVHLLPHAITAMGDLYPKLRFDLSEDYEDLAPFNRLASGQFDVMLGHQYHHVPMTVASGVDLVELGTDPVDVLLPRRHPLSSRRSISLDQLSDEDWVMYSDENIATVSIVREAADFGFSPRSVFQSAHYQTVIALVGAGIGVTLLPRMITAELSHPACVAVPLKGSTFGRTVSIATRSGSASPVVTAFIDIIADRFTQLMNMKPTR